MGKFSSRLLKKPVAKTEILVTGPAGSHKSTSIFLQRKEWRGEISESEPAQLIGLI